MTSESWAKKQTSVNINLLERIKKPWGHEVVWANVKGKDGYLAKVIYIKSGHRLSFQYHQNKVETVLVKSGRLKVETIGRVVDKHNIESLLSKAKIEKILYPGDIFHVSRLMSHRFSALDEDVELIEVSSNYPDDVVRLSDDYGR